MFGMCKKMVKKLRKFYVNLDFADAYDGHEHDAGTDYEDNCVVVFRYRWRYRFIANCGLGLVVLCGVVGCCLGGISCVYLCAGVSVLNDGASRLSSTIQDIPLTDVEDIEIDIVSADIM